MFLSHTVEALVVGVEDKLERGVISAPELDAPVAGGGFLALSGLVCVKVGVGLVVGNLLQSDRVNDAVVRVGWRGPFGPTFQ